MCDGAQLGPLDIQLSKPDEFGEIMSGLTVKQALATLQKIACESMRDAFLDLRIGTRFQVATRTALDVAVTFATGLFDPIMAQIDPLGLGENERSISISKEYGERLSASKRNLKDETLNRLIHAYPSHSFVIDREEAAKLFNEVRLPTPTELILARYVQQLIEARRADSTPIVEFLTVPQAGDQGGPNGNAITASGGVHQASEQASGTGIVKPAAPDESQEPDPVTAATDGDGHQGAT